MHEYEGISGNIRCIEGEMFPCQTKKGARFRVYAEKLAIRGYRRKIKISLLQKEIQGLSVGRRVGGCNWGPKINSIGLYMRFQY
jgi:hypothetical protein